MAPEYGNRNSSSAGRRCREWEVEVIKDRLGACVDPVFEHAAAVTDLVHARQAGADKLQELRGSSCTLTEACLSTFTVANEGSQQSAWVRSRSVSRLQKAELVRLCADYDASWIVDGRRVTQRITPDQGWILPAGIEQEGQSESVWPCCLRLTVGRAEPIGSGQARPRLTPDPELRAASPDGGSGGSAGNRHRL